MIEKLGKYDIVGELGKGAMGVVYKGVDPMIGRTVAIKTVKKSALESSAAEEILARFKQEAISSGRLSHPNIVVIYEYGEDGETGFIAMAYVEGRELKSYFNNNELFSLQGIVKIMKQLLSALDYAHKEGVVHRDIKPSNIMVKSNGDILIMDFGIARIETSELTQIGTALGTPNYMSPEQCMGQRVDGRADIFSAGVIFYQLLTGEKPFDGNSITSIYHKILNVEPVAPSNLNFQIPRAFDEIIAKSLAKRPEDRYHAAAEFAEAIEKAVAPAMGESEADDAVFGRTTAQDLDETRAEATIAAPMPGTDVSEPTTMQPQTPPQAAPTEPSPPQHHPESKTGLFVGIIIAVLLLAGGGFYFMTSSGKKADLPQPSINAESQTTTPIQPAQIVQPGKLNIKTEPAGAKVMLTGKGEMGTSPLELNLKPGVHELTFVRNGFYDIALAVAIGENENVPLTIKMEKMK